MVSEGPRRADDDALPRPRFDSGRLERVFGRIEAAVDRDEVPMAILALAGSDGPIDIRAFGSDGGRRTGARDRVLVASITKPIVATTVMQLVEEGRIALREPLVRHLPELTAPAASADRPGGEEITAWHLLTHTSGMLEPDLDPLTIDVASGAAESPPTAGDMLDAACRRPLIASPGSEFHYASDTFFLLAELVRRFDGTATYEDSLRARLLEPLGMTATSFAMHLDGWHSPRTHLVGSPDDVTTDRLAAWFATLAHPGGGLWSTAEDLVAFGRMMMHGGSYRGARIIGRPFVELMTREQTAGIVEPLDPPRRPVQGLGWRKTALGGTVPGSERQFDHPGATGSRLWVDPVHGLVVALLANRWGTESIWSDAVVSAVYGALED
jgi:CubicO group peptidase (beta-lactamase class C family)